MHKGQNNPKYTPDVVNSLRVNSTKTCCLETLEVPTITKINRRIQISYCFRAFNMFIVEKIDLKKSVAKTNFARDVENLRHAVHFFLTQIITTGKNPY